MLALRPDAISLEDCYAPGRHRERSYAEMLRRIAAPLARGRTVCAVFYGHPGVFASAPHEAVRRARAAGHGASMLPAISAEDCLAADLELDLATDGVQSFEASDFLLRPRRFDPRSGLVLWQVGAIGVEDYRRETLWSRAGVAVLAARLLEIYPATHEVVLYEAAQYAVCAPRIERRPLRELARAPASVITTVYVPPVEPAPIDANELAALGLDVQRRTRRRSTAPTRRRRGSLAIVGLGYGAGGQVTRETRALLDSADTLFFLVSEATAAAWLRARRPDARSLAGAYRRGEPGLAASRRMVARIRGALERGREVCVAFSGHPALYLHTSHAALAAARALGVEASLHPAVSCEGNLVADLGLDPAPHGRLLYEATDLLLRPRTIDPTALLVLLQVGAIGERGFRADGAAGRAGRRALGRLAQRLAEAYPADQELLLYRSARLPWLEPEVTRIALAELPAARPAVDATLVVPPRRRAQRDPAMARRLGVSSSGDPSSRRSRGSADRGRSGPTPD